MYVFVYTAIYVLQCLCFRVIIFDTQSLRGMLLALRRVCPRYILCPLPLSIYFRHSHCYGQHAIFRSSVVLKHTWISPEQVRTVDLVLEILQICLH